MKHTVVEVKRKVTSYLTGGTSRNLAVFRGGTEAALRFRNASSVYANGTRGRVCALAYAASFVPTRIQEPIYIYDVSRLDDTATGYAGLEPAGTSRKKWERGGNRAEKEEGSRRRGEPREKH